ncbi:D-inositol-3-phosphate glycosyltransferase [Neolewinella maritima]|uniref:D-inositol-3-phosphate glycosyltransferase n=1 Tax=Neolewinella maritima TaxID=1383882 RepID=A0ABM9B2B1_9BACT|nr:glycosyltransferase family 4 protein [Neolewinella maritima]CAH1001339.1 D-inositol-3-phosphate glycosyltransferase [Neolewinella maritima]
MITVSHPTGNANLRAAIDGMEAAGILSHYYTAIATYPGNAFDWLSKIGPLEDFSRRSFSPGLASKTQVHPWKELGRLLASKTGMRSLTQHETGLLSVDAVYQSIDEYVAGRLIKEQPKAVYAYEDGAATSFERARQLGIATLYDLPIGYWRTARRMLNETIAEYPEWATTIKGVLDSPEKVARKDRELELSDQIFVASTFTADSLKDYPGKLAPVHIIPYGFPTPIQNRQYDSVGQRPLRLLFVGGLSQRKGIAELFAAVDHFGDKVTLTVVGRKVAEDCAPLNAALAKHRYIPSMPHQQVLALMREHDLLVFPSHFEGFGLVMTEAMSQGTPVITTERTAGPDIIEHGEDGYIVPAGSTEALINQIDELVSRPERVAEVGRAASRRAAQRPWSAYGHELAVAIQDVLR